MFKHFTNSDDTCSKKPSVIEMFAQRTCLYFPAMEYSVHTGVYAMFSKETSEGVKNEDTRISAQFFNNNQCRKQGNVVGPPGGDIGHPIRARLRRSVQMIGHPGEGGDIGGPGIGMPGENPDGPPADEGDHLEPGPGHWAPPSGDESEIMDLDNVEDTCISSTSTLLGPTTLDASISAFSTVAIGTYFDFVSNSLNNGEFGSTSSSSSSSSGSNSESNDEFQFATTADKIFGLIIWGFGGLAFGLTIFFVYATITGTDLFPKLVESYPTDRSNTFMVDAENDLLTESKHSTHALLNQDSHL